MKKVRIFMTILLVFSFVILGACNSSTSKTSSGNNNASSSKSNSSKSDSSSSKKEDITFWTMQLSPTFDNYINGVIKNFEAQNPNIHVKWVDIPWGDMQKKILAAVSSKTAPDVANLNPQFAAQLAQLNALVNMDKAVPKATQEKYFQGVWKSNTFNNQTFGIPWYLSTQVTMYNTKILKDAGLDPSNPPKTYDDVLKVAGQIKSKTGKYVMFPPMDASHILETMVMMGAKLTTPDGKKAAFNTPEGLHAFQWFTTMYKKGYIPRSVLTAGHEKAINLYQAGDLAFFNSGPQFLTQIKKNAPDVLKVTDTTSQLTGKSGKKNIAAMNLVVPKQSKHQAAAVKFALFITNGANQLKFDKLTTILPSIKTAYNDDYFQKLPANATPIDKARIVSAAQLKDSEVLVPPMKNYNDLQDAIKQELEKAMLGQKSPKQALQDAATKWNKILNQ